MYAVIKTGGKQYRVAEGDTIEVEKLPTEVGSEIRFDDVLLIGTEDETKLGAPTVEGAHVTGKVVHVGRAPKVLVYKFRRRTKYRRKTGHRQAFTRVLIQGITVE
ncbi:MAG: 50S ribosomal protein L21 [Deltaproteobacteria bacterium]|nr:50S ribosomal protein L21 [Deltaproteobacteria bacterium]